MANILNTRSIVRDVVRCLLPVACAGCGCVLKTGERIVCLHCRYALRRKSCIEEMRFPYKIYVPLENNYFLAVYHPGSIIQRLIHAMKYSCRPDLASELGCIIKQFCPFHPTGTLVPVPQTIYKKRKRGYNQAELLARAIHDPAINELRTDVLRRGGRHLSQTGKSRIDRIVSLPGNIYMKEDSFLAEPVWIIDDVLTTGSTMNACISALSGIGIQRFGIIVLASA